MLNTTRPKGKDTQVAHDNVKARAKWDSSKSQAFTMAFNITLIENVKDAIDDLYKNKLAITENAIDHITGCIEQVYKECGIEAGVIKCLPNYKQKKNTGITRKKTTPVRPWFHTECAKKRKELFQAKKRQIAMVKEALNIQNKAYRSALKGARQKYYRELHTNLRSLRSKNPKEYWSIINKASGNDNKSGNITLENFMEHFKNLNATESPADKSNHEQVHEPFTDLPFNSPVADPGWGGGSRGSGPPPLLGHDVGFLTLGPKVGPPPLL